jgi:hypothetical protein
MGLRVEIDGSWSAEDFARMFTSVNDIYGVFALVKVERDSAEEIERYFREFEEYYPFPLRRLPRRLRGRFAVNSYCLKSFCSDFGEICRSGHDNICTDPR